MKIVMLLMLCAFSAKGAPELDQKLQQYIEDFNLTPISPPAPLKREIFILGRELFFETALSGNNNISCAQCHHPRVMTHDSLPLALGEGARGIEAAPLQRLQGSGRVQARNTPAIFNLHNVNTLFWDGRVEFDPTSGTFTTPITLPNNIAQTLKSALAAQAIFPLVNREEMLGQKGSNPIANAPNEIATWELIVSRILAIPRYREYFNQAFPGQEINIGHVGEALAEFERQAFYFADTPYDRYLRGDKSALSREQKMGMDVFFNKGRCGECHHGEHLSALDFDSVGVPQIGPGNFQGDDFGRYQWDQQEDSKYSFRVPPLRNVGLTAPYMHNGAFASLEQVVEHYDDIATSLESYRFTQNLINYLQPLAQHDPSKNETRLSLLAEDLPLQLKLTPAEEAALVEFLARGLTDLRLQ